MKINKEYLEVRKTAGEVSSELEKGLETLNKIRNPLVSFFGSHLVKEGDAEYKHCYQLSKRLASEGFGIVTGGGPGMMEAANRGAKDAGAPSIGIKASLIKNEKVSNPAYTDLIDCKYLFIRRFLLSIRSEALIFYPGGFGTLNELFEYVVLIQTRMIDKVPVICVGKEFWSGLFDWVNNKMIPYGFLPNGKKDLSIIDLADDIEEVINIIPAPARN